MEYQIKKMFIDFLQKNPLGCQFSGRSQITVITYILKILILRLNLMIYQFYQEVQ